MQGYLHKRAVNSARNWRKRWFVLDGKSGDLAYY